MSFNLLSPSSSSTFLSIQSLGHRAQQNPSDDTFPLILSPRGPRKLSSPSTQPPTTTATDCSMWWYVPWALMDSQGTLATSLGFVSVNPAPRTSNSGWSLVVPRGDWGRKELHLLIRQSDLVPPFKKRASLAQNTSVHEEHRHRTVCTGGGSCAEEFSSTDPLQDEGGVGRVLSE